MSFLIWALLSAVQLMRTASAIENFFNNYEGKSMDSLACNNEALKTLTEKMDQLVCENENLRLRMETLNLIINQQFQELKTSCASESNNNHERCCYSYENLIDVRSDLDDRKPIWPTAPNHTASDFFTPSAKLPTNCEDAIRSGGRGRGLYKINVPESTLEPFFVYCEEDPKHEGAAWLIVQRRRDGSIDFYRNWSEYRAGFGNLEGEFFIGLEKLHALTHASLHELWLELEDFEGERRWAKYSSFAVGSARESFALQVLGNYTGDAGDSLTIHAGQKFSAPDTDNDAHELLNCAVEYTGAWWYNKCHESNLNGQYLGGAYAADQYGKGIDWYKFHQHHYSLKYVHMAIRPVSVRK